MTDPREQAMIEDHLDDDHEDDCPNCGGEGQVWGCFEDTCVCINDDGLGCAPCLCDWCRPVWRRVNAMPEGGR